ncbi:MAG: ABC transporter ATP-binding protein [Spirochaetales bacterium]|nr:ABC transporter ATP-binding protein [Spirochaetales bacterium]
MKVLNVQGICKRYDKFYLDDVSFSLDEGYIMGFIGSNGAGKTTTLKGILNVIHKDAGTVEIFGKNIDGNEIALKQDIAFMMGSSDYYPGRKLKTISSIVQRFYSNWNQEAYEGYLKRFKLDPEKKVKELSQGMRIKFALTLALSHNARFIILDEPTSGLDPVARDNLLELFQELVEKGDKSILFSTHITSDLEKCADYITYINNGRIIESTTKDDLLDKYRLVNGSEDDLNGMKEDMVSSKKNSFGFTGLIETVKLKPYKGINAEVPTLDDIMIYYAKKEEDNAQFNI